jgi:multicomponent Na+:H+ antiporter subunit D
MDTVIRSHLPALPILIAFAAAALILLSHRHPNLREAWTFAAAAAMFGIVWMMLPAILSGASVSTSPLELVPRLALHLRVDPLGIIFALLASGLWIVTSLFSVGYMRGGHYGNQTTYFACFAICLGAAVGIAFSANLPTFFLFYEILTLATYPLVIHDRTDEAIAAGRKYLAYTIGAGQLLLVAMIWTQALAPGAEFTPGGFLAGRASAGTLWVLFALFIMGVGVKSAIMPLHGWLPEAMVAPTPVSALLHAVAVVKAGTFGCLRIVGYVFGVDLLRDLGADVVLAVAAAVTILIASLRALGENQLKRRLAYSTVSQLSYIVLGAALGSLAGLAGAMFHLVAHGFMKITLFFCAGSIYIRTHLKDIRDLDGLARRMPVTMGAFALGAAGLAGVPLFAGFVSKWNLAVGAYTSGHAVFIAVLLTSGLLNIAYFFPIVRDAFFRGTPEPIRFDEPRAALWIPLALTAAVAIVLGIFPDAGLAFSRLAWMAAESILAGTRMAGALP